MLKAMEELKSMIDEFVEEEKKLTEDIEIRLQAIQQSQIYLNSLYEKEDDGARIFSPRNIENQYQEEITQSNDRIKALESANREDYKQRNRLRERRERLEHIYQELDQELGRINI